jgi:hypothetical protein
MEYKLYSDKSNKFNCNIEVDGTSLDKSKVRIVVESKDMSYMFNGSIDNQGNCEITIPKTKNFLNEGDKGKMRLEVIADDVYFEPWSSDFVIQASKNVSVVIKEQVETDKPRINVSVISEPEITKPKISENTKQAQEEECRQ